MTKQEKIREGVASLTRDRFKQPAENAGLDWDENFNHYLASDILSYLHSQGVVIKVDRELPEIGIISGQYVSEIDKSDRYWFERPQLAAYRKSQQDMLGAGYAAVEPLIEESLIDGQPKY